jgi:hypothetical protein
MIDRAARDQVISAFEAYLDDQITAFEFDDRLQEIDSEDRTVIEVVRAAWFHYDDCKDHKVHLTKPEWDYFQRLLLILGTDAELSSSHSSRWSWDHLIAWLALVAFVGIAFVVGWGWHLILWEVPFGIVSILISIYRRRREPEFGPREVACTPFESLSQIRWLRGRFPGFQKRKYRAEIGRRKIRSEAVESCSWVFYYSYWLVFSPLVLLFQGFPSPTDHTLKLSTPKQDGTGQPATRPESK